MAPAPDTSVPSVSSSKSVFLTGATGYIGGTVLTKLLSLSSAPSTITVLMRSEDKAKQIASLPTPSGTTVTPLVGSLQDLEKLRKAAETHDIVVHTADADDLDAIKAIIDGAKKRKAKTGHRTLLIHTSGTGVFVDNAKGQYPSDTIYTDLHPTPKTAKSPALLSMEDLPDSALHRNVDLEIVKADAAGVLKSYIILPSTIWGEGTGEVFSSEIANSFSQQMPGMIRNALDRGRAGMVGKGANIWPHVAISDLAELYGLVYAGALRGDIGHGKSGYYFGIAGEYTLFNAASTIGSALVEQGWAKEAQPNTFTEEEMQKYYGGSFYMGSNSRGVPDRSKSIGWKAKKNEMDDFVQYLKKETLRVEKKFGKKVEGQSKGSSY